MSIFSKYKFVFYAFFCVLLSLIPRIHKLNTDLYILSGPHSQIIQMMEVWDEEGLVFHRFSGIHTYTDIADKHIHFYPRLVDAKGDNYYISYPPFSYLLAYAFAKLFHLPYHSGTLWLLNLLLLWVASIFTLKILDKYYSKNIWVQMASLLVMVFLPSSLRLHSEVYFAESLAVSILPIWFWYFHKFIYEKKYWFILFVLSFIISYTDWLGIILLVSASIFLVLKNKKISIYTVLLSLSAFLSIGLYFYQYSLLVGIDGIYDAFIERYYSRSGLRAQEVQAGDTVFKQGFGRFIIEKLMNAYYVTPFILFFLFVFSRFIKGENNHTSDRFQLLLLAVVLIVNQAIFLNFSLLHQYTFARWELVIAICVAIFTQRIIVWNYGKWVVITLVVLNIVLNGWFYERLIEKDRAPETLIQLTECLRPEMESGYSNFYKIIGESEIEPGGQLMFYLKRNFMRIESPELAHQYLSNWGREKFKFFEINGKFDAVFIYKFEAGNKVDERLLKCKQ